MNNSLYSMPLTAKGQANKVPKETDSMAADLLPKKEAIALAYDQGDYAPRVVAKGRGLIAEQIIARAKEHKVFVHESRELVALLMQVDLDDHIPPALYQAIAEILAWLYRLEEGKAEEKAMGEELQQII